MYKARENGIPYLLVFFRQFFAGHIFELCVFIQSQRGSTQAESTHWLSFSLALS